MAFKYLRVLLEPDMLIVPTVTVKRAETQKEKLQVYQLIYVPTLTYRHKL